MKKISRKATGQEIPELTRDQLGTGVRGKYYKHITQKNTVAISTVSDRKQTAFSNTESSK